MSLELDLSEFIPAMELYVNVSKKASSESLNKKSIDIAKTAMAFTPFATPTTIKQSLTSDPHLLAALTSIHLGKGNILPSPRFKQAMIAFEKSRQQGIKYLRSGFIPIVEALGSVVRGGKESRAPGKASYASEKSTALFASKSGVHSYANVATPIRLETVLVWVTDQKTDAKKESAEEIAMKALQMSIDYQWEVDLPRYLESRLGDYWH